MKDSEISITGSTAFCPATQIMKRRPVSIIPFSNLHSRSKSFRTKECKQGEDYCRVLAGVYLSNYKFASCRCLKNENISTVISCIPLKKRIHGVSYHFFLCNDSTNENICRYFDGVNALIEENLSSGKNVLVNCHAGISRSATLIIAYLMKKRGFGFSMAFRWVLTVRHFVQPNSSFLKQLQDLEILPKKRRIPRFEMDFTKKLGLVCCKFGFVEKGGIIGELSEGNVVFRMMHYPLNSIIVPFKSKNKAILFTNYDLFQRSIPLQDSPNSSKSASPIGGMRNDDVLFDQVVPNQKKNKTHPFNPRSISLQLIDEHAGLPQIDGIEKKDIEDLFYLYNDESIILSQRTSYRPKETLYFTWQRFPLKRKEQVESYFWKASSLLFEPTRLLRYELMNKKREIGDAALKSVKFDKFPDCMVDDENSSVFTCIKPKNTKFKCDHILDIMAVKVEIDEDFWTRLRSLNIRLGRGRNVDEKKKRLVVYGSGREFAVHFSFCFQSIGFRNSLLKDYINRFMSFHLKHLNKDQLSKFLEHILDLQSLKIEPITDILKKDIDNSLKKTEMYLRKMMEETTDFCSAADYFLELSEEVKKLVGISKLLNLAQVTYFKNRSKEIDKLATLKDHYIQLMASAVEVFHYDSPLTIESRNDFEKYVVQKYRQDMENPCELEAEVFEKTVRGHRSISAMVGGGHSGSGVFEYSQDSSSDCLCVRGMVCDMDADKVNRRVVETMVDFDSEEFKLFLKGVLEEWDEVL